MDTINNSKLIKNYVRKMILKQVKRCCCFWRVGKRLWYNKKLKLKEKKMRHQEIKKLYEKNLNKCEFVKAEKFDKIFPFNIDKVKVFNVNKNVIKHLNFCLDLEKYDDFKEIENKIKKDIKNDKNIKEGNKTKEERKNSCLDLLGVYVASINEEANILLAKNKINEVAKTCKIAQKDLYDFVKLHEFGHAIMCEILVHPVLDKYIDIIDEKPSGKITPSATSIIIEESFATAFALKNMKGSKYFEQLLEFVDNQPIQYKYGHYIYDKYEKCIEHFMVFYKFIKYLRITSNKQDLPPISLDEIEKVIDIKNEYKLESKCIDLVKKMGYEWIPEELRKLLLTDTKPFMKIEKAK